MQQVSPHLYQINLGAVNVFLVEDANGLTLIDAGYPGSQLKIFAAIAQGGKNPQAIQHLILTHCHPDHVGSAAEIRQATGARVYAHRADAPLIARGVIEGRPRHLSPGVLNWVLFQLFIKRASPQFAAVPVDEELRDSDVLPLAGGLEVIHTPGHSAGHIALLLRQDGVLIGGDICAHLLGLDYSAVYEDRALGRQSILKAARYGFDKAVFGHGKLLAPAASEQLQTNFASPEK